jgi:glycosyltransferase involved in cell wall biosynthesis
MAAGVPTASSDIEPIAGIAGGAALRFDPRDPGAMVAALRRITADEALREAGPRRASEF